LKGRFVFAALAGDPANTAVAARARVAAAMKRPMRVERDMN
jgi:hypothetical protein